MTPDALSQLLILYDWFLRVGLIVFLLLIARFYQRFSGEKTYYPYYIVPVLLFGIQAVRQTNFSDDATSDLLGAGAGLVLVALCALLYRRMTSGRKMPR